MSQQNNRETNEQKSLIEDLTVSEDQAAEIKDGPLGDGSVRLLWNNTVQKQW